MGLGDRELSLPRWFESGRFVAALLSWTGPPRLFALLWSVGGIGTGLASSTGDSTIAALGAPALIFHLGRNRFLIFTACFNSRWSSPVRSFPILATFIIVGGIVAVIAVFREWSRHLSRRLACDSGRDPRSKVS